MSPKGSRRTSCHAPTGSTLRQHSWAHAEQVPEEHCRRERIAEMDGNRKYHEVYDRTEQHVCKLEFIDKRMN